MASFINSNSDDMELPCVVIFLDVDGVLNILSDTYRSFAYTTLGSDPIEPHLMVRLEWLIRKAKKHHNVRLVISSSWFKEQLITKMTKARFKYIDMIDHVTPRQKNLRGEQIKDYLDKHKDEIINYVVLEDEVSDVCGRKCDLIPKHKVIEVDMNEGLSNKDTLRAACVLMNWTFMPVHKRIGKKPMSKRDWAYYENRYENQSIDDLNRYLYLYNHHNVGQYIKRGIPYMDYTKGMYTAMFKDLSLLNKDMVETIQMMAEVDCYINNKEKYDRKYNALENNV